MDKKDTKKPYFSGEFDKIKVSSSGFKNSLEDTWKKIKSSNWFKEFENESLNKNKIPVEVFEKEIEKFAIEMLDATMDEELDKDDLVKKAITKKFIFTNKNRIEIVPVYLENKEGRKLRFELNFKSVSNYYFDFDDLYQFISPKKTPLLFKNKKNYLICFGDENNFYFMHPVESIFILSESLTRRSHKVLHIDFRLFISQIQNKNKQQVEQSQVSFHEALNSDFLIIENLDPSTNPWDLDNFLVPILHKTSVSNLKVLLVLNSDKETFVKKYLEKTTINKQYLQHILQSFFDKVVNSFPLNDTKKSK
ncbi:hypothetical protein ACA758_00730 [Mycoplasmopsis agassizii]|uniref:hypothetical protein n=1 Tax=Mycoplasmopsis agassizii TaxID=33922 RepID=UPI0035288F3E